MRFLFENLIVSVIYLNFKSKKNFLFEHILFGTEFA